MIVCNSVPREYDKIIFSLVCLHIYIYTHSIENNYRKNYFSSLLKYNLIKTCYLEKVLQRSFTGLICFYRNTVNPIKLKKRSKYSYIHSESKILQ